jgi:hypothetical protein
VSKASFDYGVERGFGLGFVLDKAANIWCFSIIIGPFWWAVEW